MAQIAPADRQADAGSQDLAITAALAEAGAAPAVTTPTRPLPRPRRIAASNAAPAAAASAPPALAPMAASADAAAAPDAAAVPAPAAVLAKTAPVETGAPLVQIGAFDSGAIAESEWSRVSGRYSDLFAGKAPVVQEHKAGGRTFYRLRIAGFGSREDARKFCAALIAAGTDCIPAVAK
ncbi:SPOR domain-containing protein [Paracoccus contaminans]|uniref:SPOR domain-containing protein n=1 Tax=Paracoccus contaminans TaxID=1945662 RepID=UPI0012F52223|nr:SPOR domain-containing protein [Paracoccus contaminans]